MRMKRLRHNGRVCRSCHGQWLQFLQLVEPHEKLSEVLEAEDFGVLVTLKKYNIHPIVDGGGVYLHTQTLVNTILLSQKMNISVAAILDFARTICGQENFQHFCSLEDRDLLNQLVSHFCCPKLFEQVLAWGMSPDGHNESLWYPLHFAAHVLVGDFNGMRVQNNTHGDPSMRNCDKVLAMVELLLAYGANLNALNLCNESPLLLLMDYMDSEEMWRRCSALAYMFLRHGAIVNHVKIAHALMCFVWQTPGLPLLNITIRNFRAAGLRPSMGYRVQHNRCALTHGCRCCHIVRQIKNVESPPDSLSFLCRIAIRNELIYVSGGTSILKRIDQLPIPRLLIDYLKLSDVIGPEAP